MKTKLFVASLGTLGLLFGMLLAVFLLGLYTQGGIPIPVVFAVTIIFNVVMWLIGPAIMDWTLRFFYKAAFYNSQADFAAAYPKLADFVSQTAQQNKISFPKVRVINDDNPTAYSFGSGTWNARLVFTQGIITYLEEDEVEAVLAHELGHIVHRDFIIMSIANALIQLMYEIYYILAGRRRGSNDREDGRLALIGWLAFVFYIIGTYIVLYLNRLREYYADEFSAETTKYSDALERALVKVAYGIMAAKDDARSTRLMESTKTMGIMSLQSAKGAGLAVKVTNYDSKKVARVMLFDIVSPWAKIAEISSTHPLTGKRLLRLQKLAMAAGKPAIYDMQAARQEAQIDKKKLWSGFFIGAIMHFLIWILVIAAILIGLITGDKLYNGALFYVFEVIVIGSLIYRIFYRYPSVKNAQPSNVYDLMTDIYANPVRGRPVHMEGQLVGRGVPGYVFSEDMMMQDSTGLLYLDYQGKVPLISNLMFAIKKLKTMIGKSVKADGWFYRSNVQMLRLKRIDVEGKTIKSYPRLWSFVGTILLLFVLAILPSFVSAGADSNFGANTGTASTVASSSSNSSPTPSTSTDTSTGQCYKLSGLPEFKVSTTSNCILDAIYDGAAVNHYSDNLSLNVAATPNAGTLASQVSGWSKVPGTKVVSDTALTVDGLPAEQIVYTDASDPTFTSVVVFVDSTSRLKGDAPIFTEITANYSDTNKQEFAKALTGLKIESVKTQL